MILKSRARRAVSTAMVLVTLAVAAPALAQEISESHLKAARAAITSIHATDDFDKILPQAGGALMTELIRKNPDLQDLIVQTVNEETLVLAARRADLEKEAALAYAKVFTEADLNAIAAFYGTEAGKKLIAQGPRVTQELFQAANIWQRGVARDLAAAVGAKLDAVTKAQAPAPAPQADADAPAPDQAPAQ